MDRPAYIRRIDDSFAVHPVTAILGPRQCGKTTLARMYTGEQGEKPEAVFDLEDPTDLARLADPKLALQGLSGLVVIDQVQRAPGLFEVLRVLVDRVENRARFLVLGSASPELIRQSSETLAGRIEYIELTPFQLTEVGGDGLQRLWLRGGFPRSYLAKSNEESMRWRQSFLRTFLERDIPSLGLDLPAAALRRFWMMLTHYHGQTLNAAELGRSMELDRKTVKRYVDLLAGAYMVRELQPWFANISKRQVKSSKLYLRDSGILHAFLDAGSLEALRAHPKLGASWEGFALEETIRASGAEDVETYFWASHQGAELDLLVVRGGRKTGYEIKYTSAPRVTKSMRIAAEDLGLDEVVVVYPGEEEFPLAEGVRAVGLGRLADSEVRERPSAGG